MAKQQGSVLLHLLLGIMILFASLLVLRATQIDTHPQEKLQTTFPQPSTTNKLEQPTNPLEKTEITIYKSRRVESTIEVPAGFEVAERDNSVMLTGKDGKISIGVNGTNYDNPNDYLNKLSELNHRVITNQRNLIIDNKPAIFAKITASVINETLLSYIIYFDHWIITIETDVSSLSGTLDQIAQSYKKS